MSKKHYRLLAITLSSFLIVLTGCGKRSDTTDTTTDSTPEVETSLEEWDVSKEDSSVDSVEEDQDAGDTKGKIEIGEEMDLAEAAEIDDTYEATGEIIRAYIVFSISEDSTLDDEIDKLTGLLSSDPEFEVRRKVGENEISVSMTDTSLDLLKKDTSIERISIMEEADTNKATVSQ